MVSIALFLIFSAQNDIELLLFTLSNTISSLIFLYKPIKLSLLNSDSKSTEILKIIKNIL